MSDQNSQIFLPKSDFKKLNIIRRVAMKLEEEQKKSGLKVLPAEKKPLVFTGLQPKVLKTLTTLDEINVEVKEVDRSVIYSKLMELYTVCRLLPTTYQLFKALGDDLPSYMDIGEFRKLLAKLGFRWKHLAYHNFVVTEQPEIVFDRHRYLGKIIQYRQENRPIYFIDENCFDTYGYFYSPKKYFEETKYGGTTQWKKIIYTVSSSGVELITFIDDFNEENMLNWIKDKLLSYLSEPSVIVLDNSKHHCEERVKLPNQESTRNEMTNWLDYFNIPYDNDAPKAILFELIEKCTDISNPIYKLDNILNCNGHSVLRVPNCINKMTPAGSVFEIIQNNLNTILCNGEPTKQCPLPEVEAKFFELIESINDDLASQITDFMKEQEITLYQNDCNVDSILDQLEENMREVVVQQYVQHEDSYIDSEVPSCSDSD